jgi:hypothetical protein
MKISVESERFIKGMDDAYNLFIEKFRSVALYITLSIDVRPRLVFQLPNHIRNTICAYESVRSKSPRSYHPPHSFRPSFRSTRASQQATMKFCSGSLRDLYADEDVAGNCKETPKSILRQTDKKNTSRELQGLSVRIGRPYGSPEKDWRQLIAHHVRYC